VRQVLAGFAVIAISAAAPAVAQTQTPTQAQAQAPKSDDADKVICEREEDTGSRLSAHKICHTRSQWAQIRRDDRSATERTQSERTMDYNGH